MDEIREVISLKDISYTYSGEKRKEALSGVSLSVQKGEFLAILGHNGSGKSTLARILNGLFTPTNGKAVVLGYDVSDEKNLFEIRKRVGLVFQNPDNQTVASIVEDDVAFGPENIGVPRKEIGERIAFALDAVGMSVYANASTSRLSGGQKQRIAIAGVLALKPEIMVLDEPTAMLDPKGRKEVMDVLSRLNKDEGITIVLITHFPEEACRATRAVAMNRGKIVMDGEPFEILKNERELLENKLTLPLPIKIERAIGTENVSVPDTLDADELASVLAPLLTKKDDDRLPVPPSNGKIAVKAEDLVYTYDEKTPFETPALKGVSLTVTEGDFYGIIGHTGSGKSTFVQHLNALVKMPTAEKKYKKKKNSPSFGKLFVGGFDLSDKKTDFLALRKKVGMVFQYPEYQLFAETVANDVAFGLKNFSPDLSEREVEIAVKDAVETVGLCYEEVKNRSPFELSGGQRRRVAIAGVIVSKPEILVLDEPAAGLDPLGKEEIMRLLHEIHRKWCKTVIFVSHDMDEIAENCNRACVFSGGKAVAEDTPEKLFSDPEKLYALGLDVPFTAKVSYALKKDYGVFLSSDLTGKGFVCAVNKRIGGTENA